MVDADDFENTGAAARQLAAPLDLREVIDGGHVVATLRLIGDIGRHHGFDEDAVASDEQAAALQRGVSACVRLDVVQDSPAYPHAANIPS